MSSSNQSSSFLNSSRRSELFSNRSRGNDSMASRQSKEDSLLTASRFKSSCYEGKVSFGGASAKRMRFSQTLPYSIASKPTTITRIKDSDIKRQSEFDNILSKATQRMLDNLNKASSPLEDAKRLPVFDSSLNQSSNEKLFIDINKRPIKRLSSSRTPRIPNLVPTSPPIDREKLQLKFDELQNTKHHSSNNSFKNSSSFNNIMTDSGINYLNQPHAYSAGGKMKSKLKRTHGISSRDDEMPYQLEHLPNIPLKINNNSLPVINFNKRSNVNSKNDEFRSNKRPLVSITQDDEDTYEDEFKFSAPKAIKLEKISDSFLENSIRSDFARRNQQPKSTTIINPINFPTPNKTNQPEKTSTSPTKAAATTTSFSSSIQFTSSTATSNLPTDLETNKTVEINKLDKIDTDFNPKENKATLANTLPITKSSFNFDNLNKEAFVSSINKTWECDTCLVRNELSAVKCIACELPRLNKEKSLDKNSYNSGCTDFKFGNISLERKGFNAFKFDSINKPTNLEQPATDNNTSNSALTNILNTVNSIQPATTSALSNQTTNLLTTTTVSSKLATPDKKTDSLTNLTSTVATKESNEIKPFTFVTSEDVDKLNSSSKSVPSCFSSSSVSNSTTTTTVPKISSDWGTQFQKPKDSWSCKECFVTNKLSDKKCVCCEAVNPATATQEDSKPKASTGITLSNSSTGGFKFNLEPSTASSTAKSGFGSLFDSSKLNTDSTKPAAKGFSFAIPSTDKTENKTTTAEPPKFTFGVKTDKPESKPTTTEPIKFSFGAASASLSSNQSITNKPISLTESKSSDTSSSLNSSLTNNTIKSPETNSLFSKAITDATSNNNKSIFPSNGPVFSGFSTSNLSTSNEIKKPEDNKSTFVFGQPQSISLTNNTTNLNSNESKFNLSSNSLTNNSALNPQSTSFFPSAGQTASLNSFNQFGSSKNQFGLSSTQNIQPASTNIFTSSLTNGFAAPKDTAPPPVTNNLFSAPAPAINQAPVNNFGSTVFSQVPSSFNFGQTSTDQPQVFQFSSQPVNPQSVMSTTNLQGRQIRKAKRRLNSEK